MFVQYAHHDLFGFIRYFFYYNTSHNVYYVKLCNISLLFDIIMIRPAFHFRALLPFGFRHYREDTLTCFSSCPS